jgi:GNAT superfamily N-acetyltransferase
MTYERRRDDYLISTARERIDLALVHRFLSEESYWARNIPLALVERAVDHSLPFGVYHAEQQVGFGRLITDYATFAYLADVFIVAGHRGRGLGTWLVQSALEHPELQSLRWWLLVTQDAHEVYRRAGFSELTNPERFMALRLITAYTGQER